MIKHATFMTIKRVLLVDTIINAIVDRAAKKHGWVYADKLDDKLHAKVAKLYILLTK